MNNKIGLRHSFAGAPGPSSPKVVKDVNFSYCSKSLCQCISFHLYIHNNIFSM